VKKVCEIMCIILNVHVALIIGFAEDSLYLKYELST